MHCFSECEKQKAALIDALVRMGNAQADYVIAEPRDLRVHQSTDGSTPVDQSGDSTDDVTARSALIRTGTLDQPTLTSRAPEASSSADWSSATASGLDWSQPTRRFSDDELKLDWSDSNDGDENESESETTAENESETKFKNESETKNICYSH